MNSVEKDLLTKSFQMLTSYRDYLLNANDGVKSGKCKKVETLMNEITNQQLSGGNLPYFGSLKHAKGIKLGTYLDLARILEKALEKIQREIVEPFTPERDYRIKKTIVEAFKRFDDMEQRMGE